MAIKKALSEPNKVELSTEHADTLPLDVVTLVKESVYPTDQYLALFIPYCTRCGEKLRTGLYGEPICPIEAREDCPIIGSKIS